MAKRLCVLAFSVLLAFAISYSQEQQLQEDKDDAYEEASSNNLTLRFYNAISGIPIPRAGVDIKEIGSYVTDAEGRIRFPAPAEDAAYSFTFQAAGYVTSQMSFEVTAGSVFQRRYSISPALDIRFLRVILDWGAEPRDLDAHFLKDGGYHISYRNMKTLTDGNALLDRDDMDGYGPETITIKEVSKNATYRYFVHDFTNQRKSGSRSLSKSRAMVKVIGDGRILKTINVPADQIGTIWDVFQIIDGQVSETNSVKSE